MGENDVLPDMRMVRASSITSNKSSRRRKNHRKKKAKEWTYYIETLKSSIDCLYEICRTEQSIPGCKEAMMYLQNADKDFQSLIEAINLERTFSKEDPQAVAWEIRKSVNSPTHNFHEKKKLMGVLPISPIVINEMVSSAAATVKESDGHRDDGEDGWQVVRNRRRKSTSSSLTESERCEQQTAEEGDENTRPRPQSVYDRLTSGISCRKHGVDSPTRMQSTARTRGASIAGKLTCPRSAMDLPQTKASMAKISYCRQRLWEKDVKPNLAEKLARQKRERVVPQRTSTSVCRINFSDPAAVRKRALEYSENLKQMRRKPAIEVRSLQSLQSINENSEMDQVDVVPCDPKPSDHQDITTRSEPPRMESLSPDLDVEWREMTEEEQSLAMEEQSLNLEIEKAESELESIDAELERQVDEEAEEHPIQEPIVEPKEDDKTAKMDIFRKMEEEFKNFLQISWSEMMDKELSGHIHEPGMVAERHEKMCSPTRRRCDKDDDDFAEKHAEKIRRADEAREKLQQERRHRLQDLAQRRDEVRAKQEALIEKKKLHMEKRMEKARENRDKNITEIVKKAKYDEQKVLEIQFINTLQDDNKRYMVQSKEQSLEERKQILVEERAKKNEEKAQKEQAVEGRRRAAEQKRLDRLRENEEKRERRAQAAMEKKKSAKQKKKELDENLTDLPLQEYGLSAIVVRQQWPGSGELEKLVTCTRCWETMTSKLDCYVHMLKESHLDKAEITPTTVTQEKMQEEFKTLKVDARPRSASRANLAGAVRDASISRNEMQKYNFKRGNDQFRGSFKEPAVTSPQAELLLDRVNSSSGELTPSVLEAVNDALKWMQKENNGNSFLSLADPLLKIIVAADESTPLTMLLKVCSLVEKCSVSVAFALKCLFSQQVYPLFDSLNGYSRTNPSSPCFSAKMDVCLSLLQPLHSRKELTDLGVEEQLVEERISLLYDLLTEFGTNIPGLVSRGDSAVKWTRIHNFASYFLAKGTEENSLSMIYIDTLLRETYEAFRLSTGNDAVDKQNRCDSSVTSSLANRMMHVLERLQQSRQPLLWASLFNHPTRNFRFCLLCTELMRRSILRMKTDQKGLEIVPQLLFLLRYFAAKSPSNQILCMLGLDKSTIGTICQLPNEFFTQPVIATQSIPTLILMTHGSPGCLQRGLLTKRICSHISAFIKEAAKNQHNRLCLKHVLPEEQWTEAVKFYHL